MLKHEWEFEYTASTLAIAAEAQRDFRKARVDAWEAKKAEVMEKVKTSGLTVHEGPAASMNNYTTANMGGAHVMVDTTLQADLSECVTKIKQHRDAIRQYEGWVQVLQANPESRLKLHQDDWLFFFGK
jgi:hypothetical protein